MNRKLKPNLFVIGAMKSGTSSLHTWLAAHPDIFMSEPKEPCYFVERSELDWPYIEQQGFWRGEDYYLDLFSGAGNAVIIGESSTLYSKAPRCSGVPQRIAQFNPNARIIYLMRDPVERTISHYWHMVMHNAESRNIFDAIVNDDHYRDVSYYAMQLRPYLEYFGPDQVLAITFEQMTAQPASTVQQVYDWLGVDSTFIPPNIKEQANVTPRHVVQVRGLRWLYRFRHSEVWDTIGPHVPSSIRRWGRRLTEKRVDRWQQPTNRTVAYLRPIQQQQAAELSELLTRSFDEWTTLFGRELTAGNAATTLH
jgi:hypothetical protein